MGEHAQFTASTDEDRTTQGGIPPQVLARWAALASARAHLSAIPQQVRA